MNVGTVVIYLSASHIREHGLVSAVWHHEESPTSRRSSPRPLVGIRTAAEAHDAHVGVALSKARAALHYYEVL